MQGGGRDPFTPFGGFGGPFGGFGGGSFGGFGGPHGPPSLMSNFFGGRDPFDDPFFTQPFGREKEPTSAKHECKCREKEPTNAEYEWQLLYFIED